jgi:hypothetical protein
MGCASNNEYQKRTHAQSLLFQAKSWNKPSFLAPTKDLENQMFFIDTK